VGSQRRLSKAARPSERFGPGARVLAEFIGVSVMVGRDDRSVGFTARKVLLRI